MAQFEIAIVGGGGISKAHIAAAKATNGRVGVTAVIDPNEAARATAAESAGAKPYATLDEFLRSADASRVKGVVVCTPPSVRIDIVRSALNRGLAVLMEKPMAHTLADARKLAELAAAHPKVVTAVGYCHRFTPGVIEIKKRIAAGAIGTVTRFENTFAGSLDRLKDHWMSDPAVSGGGSFMDTGCHSLDLLLHLLGPSRAVATVFNYGWPGRGESSSTTLLRTAGGAAAVIQSGWTEPSRFQLRIVGTGGSLGYDYMRATELTLQPNGQPEQKLTVEPHELRFQRQLEAFADAATGTTPAVMPCSFAEALASAERADEVVKLAAKA
jgi:predicted dehydrogenase